MPQAQIYVFKDLVTQSYGFIGGYANGRFFRTEEAQFNRESPRDLVEGIRHCIGELDREEIRLMRTLHPSIQDAAPLPESDFERLVNDLHGA